MSDLRDAAALVGSLKAAFDLTKAFIDVRGAVKEQEKVFELQRVILAAQQSALDAQGAQTTLLSRIDQLEKRIAELEAWEREKEQYEPAEIGRGVIAYVLKPEAQRPGPKLEFCATCFGNRHSSILQRETRMPGRTLVAVCHNCGANHYLLGPRWADQSQPSPTHGPRR